jgi:hypothetical protein
MRFYPFVKRLLLLAAVLLSVPLVGCAMLYRAEAIEGWVVDAETGKPLEGVIIVANWEVKGGLEGGVPIAELQILETVTDENGRYSFPAWGPKLVPITGQLQGDSPGLMLFKPGYRAGGFSNLYSETYGTSTFFYNKKTLKLERFKGTLAEYADALASLSSTLWVVGFNVGDLSGDYCGWKSFPRMLRALNQLDAEFRGVRGARRTVAAMLTSNDKILKEKGCGSVFEVLEGAGK